MISLIRELKNEASTIALGQELSLFATNGMVICLSGELGAGKTTFARAMIQELSGVISGKGKILEVPSPTFSLLQTYETTRVCINHFDLYRIQDIDEVYELGLFDGLENHLTLIEWPDKLDNQLPKNRIDIVFELKNDHRIAHIKGYGAMEKAIARLAEVRQFLDRGHWRDAKRCFLQGDASARRYERLTLESNENMALSVILMDMPDTQDGPVIKNNQSYAQIAHIAEGIIPVAAVNHTLRDLGFSAPDCLQQDLSNGLMIIEDFGDQVYGNLINREQDMNEPIKAAVELLAEMVNRSWPEVITVQHHKHQISKFDHDTFEIEASLLLDWYWPHIKNEPASSEIRESFFNAWKKAFALIETNTLVWVLRDFHSPNLIWLHEETGIKRVGLIDTQDCVLGHPGYDLVSMLQDARVDLPEGFEAKYFQYYCALRQQSDRNFDEKAFGAAYSALGAQRATKILGIFARLAKRDNKPGYLKHVARVSKALDQNLSHPALSEIAEWYNTHLPTGQRQSNNMEISK